ncbi:MAG: hypothetical protein ISS50_01840 [Anaerolineae bacterium]|nr:hypothetical protein [Anaerolineae bacterium]
MSIRLVLRVDEHPDPDDPTLVITRLLVWVSFLTVDGELTDPELAIVDTGAPLSLIPQDIWQGCRYLRMRDDVIRSVVPKPDCELAVIDGVVACILRDDAGQMSELLTIRAHLAHSENVPLLLGFSGLLDRADVHFSVKSHEAYLEI